MVYGIIGRTAEGIELFDGQTIKTRVLVEEIKRMEPGSRVLVADTYNYTKRAIKILYGIIDVYKRQGNKRTGIRMKLRTDRSKQDWVWES